MNRSLCSVTCILIFLLPSLCLSFDSNMMAFTGTVTTIDDMTVEGELLAGYGNVYNAKLESLPKSITLHVKNAAGVSQAYKIETTQLEKIIYRKTNRKKPCGGSTRDLYDFYEMAQVVLLKNGKMFKETTCPPMLMPYSCIYVSSRHPITGNKTYDKIPWDKVKEIRFLKPFGQVRKDEHGHIFPADYLYSPLTGKPMQLYNIE